MILNLTPGHTSRENYNLERYMHLKIHCNTVHNSQAMEKKTKCPLTNQCIKKIRYISTLRMGENNSK